MLACDCSHKKCSEDRTFAVKGCGRDNDLTSVFVPVKFSCNLLEVCLMGLSSYWARSQICEKRLLALSCPSVCLSAWNDSAPTGRILMKFDIEAFFIRSTDKSSLIKTGQE